MWASIVTAIVKGLVEPIVNWWATYNQGRNAQRAADAKAALDKTQEIQDALEEARKRRKYRVEFGPDGRLHRVPDPPAPAASGLHHSQPNAGRPGGMPE